MPIEQFHSVNHLRNAYQFFSLILLRYFSTYIFLVIKCAPIIGLPNKVLSAVATYCFNYRRTFLHAINLLNKVLPLFVVSSLEKLYRLIPSMIKSEKIENELEGLGNRKLFWILLYC
ncbi:hypothetical protein M9H77_29855 [Catharanthus roseus]|uniref:Uncharacterized protein n=1 Tax=Catharanthus roseus TaxID=4058 RepID=A0ACB9ZXU2_CATRO|nr:hypothetical protein M9H77_29855 [Catharanthus roseus]